ncbi:hypothetical protein NUW54_g14027 [Trametes sanguinea]|uniref:Uncharacterized protein n=1 Tax=Trametes sanguinea TaxID=158606 RepID=A0ACC1MFZ5_9APHY|nr:hypothetical protein NUW54_g14027 [Trametes sanguinea]
MPSYTAIHHTPSMNRTLSYTSISFSHRHLALPHPSSPSPSPSTNQVPYILALGHRAARPPTSSSCLPARTRPLLIVPVLPGHNALLITAVR